MKSSKGYVPKESEIQASICDYLAMKKHFFWRSNTTPIYDPTRNAFRSMPKYALQGIPDIILIKDGYFIGLEVKRPSTYQNEAQKEFEKGVKEAGGEYHVVRSINDVKELGF